MPVGTRQELLGFAVAPLLFRDNPSRCRAGGEAPALRERNRSGNPYREASSKHRRRLPQRCMWGRNHRFRSIRLRWKAMLQPGTCSARSSDMSTCIGPPGDAATARSTRSAVGTGRLGPPVATTSSSSERARWYGHSGWHIASESRKATIPPVAARIPSLRAALKPPRCKLEHPERITPGDFQCVVRGAVVTNNDFEIRIVRFLQGA